jgi:hypothetical protein
MISILYLIEGTPKGYLERGNVNIPKMNEKFIKKMSKAPDRYKRKKLLAAHIKLQNRVNKMPSSF